MTTSALDAILSVICMAQTHIDEIEEGIEDGDLTLNDVKDLDRKKADLELVKQLYGDASKLPVAVIQMQGGVINCSRSSIPMEIVILDDDTEGGDEENIMSVNHQEVYVTHVRLEDMANTFEDGVYPEYTAGVIEQISG